MIRAIDLRKGKTVIYNDEPAVVHEVNHVTRGKGRSLMQAKFRSLKTGTMYDVRLNVDERIETPFVESKEYEFLYKEGEVLIVMDLETYDQFPVPADVVGDAAQWLKPNERVSCQLYNGQIITFEPPMTVALKITETPPVVKGATVTNQDKDALLETGVRIRVPPFIETGEVVRVDTRTGQYMERAK